MPKVHPFRRYWLAALIACSAACSTGKLQVEVVPPDVPMSYVRIDGKDAKSIAEGRYEKRIKVPKDESRDVTVAASSKEGVKVEVETVIRAGDNDPVRVTMPAELEVSVATGVARELKIDGEVVPQPVFPYRRAIPVEGSGRPLVVEALSATGYRDARTVTLLPGRVAKAELFHRDPLRVALEVYPTASELQVAGTPLQLVLILRPGAHPPELRDVVLHFGDGSSTDLGAVTIDGQTTIVVRHAYATPGRFEPRLEYRHASPGLEGPFDAHFNPGGGGPFALRILPHLLTADQLREKAWEDAYARLRDILRSLERPADAAEARPLRIALSSLDEANFEKDDKDFVAVVERMTRLMIADGIHVLERSAAVMARLAPESVVDISKEEGDADGPVSPEDYRPHLEYGLVTGGGEGGEPLEYGIQIEGTNDRLFKQLIADSYAGSEQESRVASLEVASAFVPIEGSNRDVTETHLNEAAMVLARRDLPVLVARFHTADLLVALRAKESDEPERTPGYEYSEAFDAPMTRERMQVLLEARVLDRTGRVLHAVTIEGSAAQLVPPGTPR